MTTYFAIGAVLALLMVLYVVGRVCYRLHKYGEEPLEHWLVGLALAVMCVTMVWPVCIVLCFVKDKN